MILLLVSSFNVIKCSEENSVNLIKTEKQPKSVVTAEVACSCEEPLVANTEESAAAMTSMPLTDLNSDTAIFDKSNVIVEKPIQGNNVQELLANDSKEVTVTTNQVESFELKDTSSVFNFKTVFLTTLFFICISFIAIFLHASFKQRNNRIHPHDFV